MPTVIRLEQLWQDDRELMRLAAQTHMPPELLCRRICELLTRGTQTHMPPELLTTGSLSKAADSYAFGTLLW